MNLLTKLLTSTTLLLLFFSSTSQASMANPGPYQVAQPDGVQLTVFKRGDQHGTWYETTDGYTVRRADDGFWYYLHRTGKGVITESRFLAHTSLDNHLGKQQTISKHINPHKTPETYSSPFKDSIYHDRLLKGKHEGHVLFILVEFNDEKFEFRDESIWAAKIQDSDPDAKTIQHYYDAASYGAVSLSAANETFGTSNDGVVGPLHLNRDHPDTGGDSVSLHISEHNDIFEEAIQYADPYVDFASFDKNDDSFIEAEELAIILVVAGHTNQYSSLSPSITAHAKITTPVEVEVNDTLYDEILGIDLAYGVVNLYSMIGERIDAGHNTGASEPSTLGVFVHELGHLVYGLPDLYDSDGSTNGISHGISYYGLMGSGSQGLDPSVDSYAGQTPAMPSAWSQLKLKWVKASSNFIGAAPPSQQFPVVIGSGNSTNSQKHLTAAGAPDNGPGKPYVARARVGTQARSGPWVCDPDRTEYFLAQYRTAEGYDRGLPAVNDSYGGEYAGVVIYHVDESRTGNNTSGEMMLRVVAANNLGPEMVQAEQEQLWGLGNASQFDEFSTPNSDGNLLEKSGVSISVGAQTLDAFRNSAINLIVNSECN